MRSLNSGETLLAQGQVNNLFYIILSGRLSIQAKESGIEPMAMLGTGECVGEMSILGDGHVSAYVIAATDCKLLVIDHNALWNLIDSSNLAAHNMLKILSSRIFQADRVMAENLENHQGFSGFSVLDELTGLYNRHWMLDKFDRLLHRSIMSNKPSCLLMIEMDQFKTYNDIYGQLGSDQALRNIAYNILSCMRPDDSAGRSTGEKFAVFLSDTTPPDACAAAERLISSISLSPVVLPSGDALPSTSISVGISQVNQGVTLVSLFALAEEALQCASEAGGNCVKCAK
ncbi:MAG: GGDEF domain-containing protein [Gallionella sp.]